MDDSPSENVIVCHVCKKTYSPMDLIRKAKSFWPETEVIRTESPCCGQKEEIRLSYRRLERGYIYAAGGPHFSAEETYAVPGLICIKNNDGVRITVDTFEIFVPNIR